MTRRPAASRKPTGRHPKKPTELEIRCLALDKATTAFYDSPKENVARAAAYYQFLKRGPILAKPTNEPRPRRKR